MLHGKIMFFKRVRPLNYSVFCNTMGLYGIIKRDFPRSKAVIQRFRVNGKCQLKADSKLIELSKSTILT